jgi:hypothetical protein
MKVFCDIICPVQELTATVCTCQRLVSYLVDSIAQLPIFPFTFGEPIIILSINLFTNLLIDKTEGSTFKGYFSHFIRNNRN